MIDIWEYLALGLTVFILLVIVLAVRYALRRNEELRVEVLGKHLIVVKRINASRADAGSTTREPANHM